MVMRWGEYGRVEKELEVVIKDRVCRVCNGRWMKKLDDRIAAIMRPSITEGTSIELDPTQQLLIARWAMKVGLLLTLWVHDEAARHPQLPRPAPSGEHPYVPLDDFASVYRHQRPPERVRIWMGAVSDTPSFVSTVSALRVRTNRNPRPVRAGYYVVFILRQLIFQVLACEQDYGTALFDAFDPAVVAPGTMLPVWPTSELPIQWPPAHKLVAADIAKLTRTHPRWAEGEPPSEVAPESA